MKAKVSPDGRLVEAYFSDPLDILEKHAKSVGGWELIYKAHEGVDKVHRLSPTGDPADAGKPPEIRRLSRGEMARVEMLKQQLGME